MVYFGLLGYEDIKQNYNQFIQVESTGSEISFRCVKCRNCTTCKEHSTEDTMSIREEVEQDLINRSVKVNVNECITTATLPLLQNPETALAPNRNIALRVYNQQVKRLAKNQQYKDDIIKSESKLQSLGYVEYVKNLPIDQQRMLQSNPVQNFIPWRAVWKPSSISTPCRVVYDASMPTESGKSLNDILPKGRNGMNRLLEIFLRWRGHRFAFHTDIQKMYNTIKLDQSHWCLQRYLWHESLSHDALPDEKIIKTLIYGVKSSRNQAEFGLRETAKIFQDQYPNVYRTVSKDIYVDDCLSGHSTLEEVQEMSNELEVVISHGGFALKGVTISGSHPNENLSSDGETISVAGMAWKPKEDSIALDIKDLNFAKRYRGKKVGVINEVPAKLTRRQCVSKASEVFNLSGIITPITASLKLDLHDLVNRKLSWDDTLPENLRQLWISNFQLISEIKDITYRKAIVPEDAESLQINTLDFGDASQSIACSAIYIRFKRTCGNYSCQLIFARSRILPEDMTQPRRELVAALLNAHTSEVVCQAFSTQHNASHKFTDSQIVLHWLCNEDRPLKKWLRSRVVEIKRFSSSSNWSYIKSTDMIADIATRRCDSNEVIAPNSTWINGFPWMTGDDFPNLTAKEISLSQKEQQEVSKEVNTTEQKSHFTKADVNEASKFYKSQLLN
ncbi:uncharacterized protein [Clytia hemisphaerica]|uniref:uncharacterized protein n=1 Tax=Clytia hemisphaerica TaxID=252671 RepID=UPI0034D749F4